MNMLDATRFAREITDAIVSETSKLVKTYSDIYMKKESIEKFNLFTVNETSSGADL